jgi:hypothetical protein
MCLQAMTSSWDCLLEQVGAADMDDVGAPPAAAVQLLLELQLLAAALMQRQRAASQTQQQQRGESQKEAEELLLMQTNHLLQLQIRAALQATGSSCLPPEVLQQAGLQLLQALAAPLQQLQLGYPGGMPEKMIRVWGSCVRQQLLVLRAAAAGLASMEVEVSGRCCCCCRCCLEAS